jgi:small subunit ribosomal protein S8
MQNLLGDLITRIQNGQQARLSAILLSPAIPKNLFKILEILRDEGYILGFQEWHDQKLNRTFIKLFLKYNIMGVPSIRKIFQISKPSRRIYIATQLLWKPKSTSGIFILSTPKGFLVDREARLFNVGGELLLGVY